MTSEQSRLSIHFGAAEVRSPKALSVEILQRAYRAGVCGTVTFHGVARTPATVHIVDDAERIRAFLPQLKDLLDRCRIVCADGSD